MTGTISWPSTRPHGKSIRRARDGEGPTLIECKVARYFGHYEGDTQAYRGPDEVKKVKEECDCIVMLAAAIIRAYPGAAAELERIDTQVLASVEEAITYAAVGCQAKP